MKTKSMNRREFMERSGLGLVSAGLGLPLLNASCTQSPKTIFRTLGRSGLKIPVVSFGVMNSDSPHMLKKAIDMGITHLDTAHGYIEGKSEQVIGEVVKEMGVRNRVIISTKLYFARDRESMTFISEGGGRSPLATEENFNRLLSVSLDRLQTDYVDILYLHSCYSPAMVVYEPMLQALVKAKEEGQARLIGVSTHQNVPEVVRAAVDADVYDVVQIAYNYMDERKEEIRDANRYAAEKGVGVVAMKVMGGNRLNRDADVQINHKAALKWVLNDENVTTTIPGMTTFDQMDLNWSVMEEGFTLSEDEKRELELAYLLPGKLYCQNCRTCIETCTKRVEIPNLMRSYMYAEGYGNRLQAKETAMDLPNDRGLAACRSCNECSARCPNGIQIRDRVQGLLAMGFGGTAAV